MSTLDPEIAEELEAEEDAHGGVRTVEAAEQVFGKYSKWFLFIGYVFGFLMRCARSLSSCLRVP